MRERYVQLLGRDRDQGPDPAGGFTPIRGIGAGSRVPVPRLTPDRLLGAGDALALVEDWHPLVLVDVAALPGVDAAGQRIPWQAVAESAAGDDLRSLEPPEDTVVEPVGPLAAAAQPGDRTSSTTAGVATVGLPVVLRYPTPTLSEGFLTVSHGAPSGAVTVMSPGGSPVTGQVLFSAGSATGSRGGDDIALVGLPPGSLGGWVQNSGTQPPPAGPPYLTLPVDLFAGRTGHVLAQVNGALLQHGDQHWQWLDCWELGGTTPGMQPGDSGSLAVGPVAPHPLFGHFVGGAVNVRGGPGFTHHWVQDLGQVLSRQPFLADLIRF
ncbi:MAG TPA: hypothetical protein VGP36_08115 [Mycobacteriales bacterium]|jgi:hypothetical protein|nr:hypothetical protein [Mycobacteriales bacterium]